MSLLVNQIFENKYPKERDFKLKLVTNEIFTLVYQYEEWQY